MTMCTILLVEDHKIMADALVRVRERQGEWLKENQLLFS